MLHKVATIAKTYNLPPEDLVDFAIARPSMFSVVIEHGDVLVYTWAVEDLLAAFVQFQKEQDNG